MSAFRKLSVKSQDLVANKVDDSEKVALTFTAFIATGIGLAGGFALSMRLDGDAKVQATFWSTLLTVSALSALPLVATTTGLARLWRAPGEGEHVAYLALAPLLMTAAAGISLLEVVLCLYQVALTSGKSDPNDLVVYVTCMSAGATLGAAVFGVSWAILDKIDDAA